MWEMGDRQTVIRGSRRPVIWLQRADRLAAPGAENEQELLAPAQARGARTEDVKATGLQLAKQAPVDRAHQLGGRHRTPILGRQQLSRAAVVKTGALGDVGGQRPEPIGVLEPQDLLLGHCATEQFVERQVNAAAFRVDPDIAKDVRELKSFAEVVSVVATGGFGVTENLDAQEADDRGDSITVMLELLEGFVALDVEVHLDASDQFVEQRKGKLMGGNDGAEFAVD